MWITLVAAVTDNWFNNNNNNNKNNNNKNNINDNTTNTNTNNDDDDDDDDDDDLLTEYPYKKHVPSVVGTEGKWIYIPSLQSSDWVTSPK